MSAGLRKRNDPGWANRPGWIWLFVGAILLAGCQPTDDPAPRVWPVGHSTDRSVVFKEALTSNASFDVYWLSSDGEDLGIFLHLKAPLVPRIITFPHEGISVAEALKTTDARIVIGSGFVSEAHSLEPVGLLRVNDVQLSPLAPYGYTRVLGFNEQEAGVVHRRSYERNMYASALQAGPGIIEAGKLDISERDLQRPKYYRSFVALCGGGLSIGISTRPTNLRTLGQALVQLFAAQQLDCPEVVNLAGDRQAVLAVQLDNSSDYLFHGDVATHKVTLISFSP